MVQISIFILTSDAGRFNTAILPFAACTDLWLTRNAGDLSIYALRPGTLIGTLTRLWNKKRSSASCAPAGNL